MNDLVAGPVLLLSATEFEVAPLTEGFRPALGARPRLPEGWRALTGAVGSVDCVAVATGVGKVNAAALTALAISAYRPAAALLVGIGGAYPGSPLALGGAAMALSDTHVDTGAGHGRNWTDMRSLGFPLLPATEARPTEVFNRIELAPGAREVAERAGVPALPFGTSEAVTADRGTAALLHSLHGVSVESMEGAAVAQVAAALGVRLYQVRGISNVVGDRDRANWRVPEAVRAACSAARSVVPLLLEAR